MTTYYGHEDNVETAETQLDNVRAHLGATNAVVVWSAEQLNSIYAVANGLFNEAAQRGDEKSQNDITEIVRMVEAMHQNSAHVVTAHKNMLEWAAIVGKQKREIETQYDEVMDALFDCDTSHPAIRSLIEDIRRDVADDMVVAQEELHEHLVAGAVSEAWDEITAQIKRLFPRAKWAAIHVFVAMLDGQIPLNDIQRGLFISLLQTFEDQEAQAS